MKIIATIAFISVAISCTVLWILVGKEQSFSQGVLEKAERNASGRFAYMAILAPMDGWTALKGGDFSSFGSSKVVSRAAALCYNLKVRHGTIHDVVFFSHLPNLLSHFPLPLRQVFQKAGCQVRQLRHSFDVAKKWNFPRFSPFVPMLWGEVDYTRAIVLDLDMLVERNLDFLFEATSSGFLYAVADPTVQINAGFLLMSPNVSDMHGLIDCSRSNDIDMPSIKMPYWAVDGKAMLPWNTVQQVLAKYFQSRLIHLGSEYNYIVSKVAFMDPVVLPEEAKVFHLIGCKETISGNWESPNLKSLCEKALLPHFLALMEEAKTACSGKEGNQCIVPKNSSKLYFGENFLASEYRRLNYHH